MLLELNYIVTYVRGLMAHTEETWASLGANEGEESKKDYLMNHYYWPLFGVSALLVMLLIGCGGLFGDGVASFDLEVGMKAMVEFVIVYAVGPMLISLCVGPMFHYVTRQSLPKEKTEVFIHYTMSTLMVLEVCCAVFPNLEFLKFSKLYVVYIIAIGVDGFLQLKARDVVAIAIAIFSLMFYVAPVVIKFLFHFFDKL